MTYRTTPRWESPGIRLRPHSVYRWLAWSLLLILPSGVGAAVVGQVAEPERSFVDDIAAAGESQVLGGACLALLVLPVLFICVMYLRNERRAFVRIHEEGIVIATHRGTEAVAWEDLAGIAQLVYRDIRGNEREAGWRLESRDGRTLHLAPHYPDDVRAHIRRKLARREIRPRRVRWDRDADARS